MAVLGDPSLVALISLLVVAIALRVVRGWQVSVDLDVSVISVLRGESLAAVVTSLAMLHVEGSADAGRSGRVHRAAPLAATTKDPMLRAAYVGLHESMSPRALLRRPPVRRAVADVRKRAAAAGLSLATWRWVTQRVVLCSVPVVGVARLLAGRLEPTTVVFLITSTCVALVLWLQPRRTRAGTRVLRTFQRRLPLSAFQAKDQPLTAVDMGTAVALHGVDALNAFLPSFAREGGLLDGGEEPDHTLGDGTIRSHVPFSRG